MFLRETGWRLSEGTTLEWNQVDFSAQVVRLEPRTTKNDEGRSFPFGALPELAMLLRTQRERTSAIERETGQIVRRVFHDQGRPILKERFYRQWWRAVKRGRDLPGVAARGDGEDLPRADPA